MATVFTRSAVTRAVQGAVDAGLAVTRVEISPDGTIVIFADPAAQAVRSTGRPNHVAASSAVGIGNKPPSTRYVDPAKAKRVDDMLWRMRRAGRVKVEPRSEG